MDAKPFEPTHELVLKKTRDCFRDDEAAADALEILGDYKDQDRFRVQLAVVKLSGGSLDRLLDLMVLAESDYRDVLAPAEYPEEIRAPRDTSVEEMADIRRRDRAQYELWLTSGTDLHKAAAP